MKLTLVLSAICVLVSSTILKQPTAEKAFLKKQKDVLVLFEKISQPLYSKDYVNLIKGFNISAQSDYYTNKEAYMEFMQYYEYGFLPKGEIFSVFYKPQLKQAIALFKLFYYSRDYRIFFTTAVWARQHMNEGIFLYSYTVALAHRPDTLDVVLPPIYEIYPYYFFNTEVIQQAYIYKQKYRRSYVQKGSGYTGHTIYSNYSGYNSNLHPEQSMSYYLEDIGINSYYYYYNIYLPFWMSTEEFGFKYINRGEEYYFYYQQLLARYYLERISNDFGDIPFINWNVPIETPCYPSLEYPNGIEFPSRPPFANLYKYFYNYEQKWSFKSPYGNSYIYVQDYERRIHDVIDRGYAYTNEGNKVDLYTEEGFNAFGNLIQSNYDSPNRKYYGALWLYASHLLGYSYQPLDRYTVVPSVLEHFETALRDPVFYQLYKKIFLYFQNYYSYIPAYTKIDLVFPGVKVTDFEVDPLITYYDYYYTDISNAVYYSPEELAKKNFQVRVGQYRLNHKPFTYKFTVQSDHETKAVVKIFLGPKYDEYGRYINITENRINMVVLDYFVYDLKSGSNVITRSSYDSYYYAPDATSYYDLYKQVMGGGDILKSYHYGKQNYYYYPRRYMLPRGSYGGTSYQFYVVVYPYVPKQMAPAQSYMSFFYPYVGDQLFYDSYSLGYPFDRFIYFKQLYSQIPNFRRYDTKIYFKQNINVGGSGH